MADNRFNDGGAYERMMGVWSRLVGAEFLDWLALPAQLRCLDVGCGNGAFTQLLVDRCKPSEVQGLDPSPQQIAFARERSAGTVAEFRVGDAMALPFADDRFDAAIMALVIVFVPDPDKGVAEMVRVTRPGGIVAAYMWNMPGGGFPMQPVLDEIRALGAETLGVPRPDVSDIGALRTLWEAAGLQQVETRKIDVQRTFADLDEFWAISTLTGSAGAAAAKLTPDQVARAKDRLRAKLPADSAGRITYSAFANAVKGHVPR